MKEFDVRDLACPGPVLKLRDLLDAGEREVRFWVADELCRSNVVRFAASRGAVTRVEPHDDGTFHVDVRADAGSADPRPREDALLVCDPQPATAHTAGPLVIQVTSDTMGSGDDELGALLLRSFLKTQAQLENTPACLVFYNAGVRLCCDGSPLLDDLRALEATGIEIIACGTCLNFFGLADDLAVGRVTDMLEIASTLAAAGRTVRP
jgi:selenium metabolism protein YedF